MALIMLRSVVRFHLAPPLLRRAGTWYPKPSPPQGTGPVWGDHARPPPPTRGFKRAEVSDDSIVSWSRLLVSTGYLSDAELVRAHLDKAYDVVAQTVAEAGTRAQHGPYRDIPIVARRSWRWETTNSNATGKLTIITAAASNVYEVGLEL